jgi:tetratricopeptide (TPR) repeat protein/precorrin-6B methylase 2
VCRDVHAWRAPSSTDEAFVVQEAVAAAARHNAEGDHSRALACIDVPLASSPGNVELLVARATTLYEWGRVREALDEFRLCVSLGASDPTLPYKLAWTCLLAQKVDEALCWMRRAVELDDGANAHFGLAIAMEANGHAGEAIESFRRALSESETDFGYLTQYGLCLMAQKRLVEAEALFRRAIQAQPTSPVGWTNLGVVLSRQRRRAEALVALRKADRLEAITGENANNFVNLAVELSDDGRLGEALAVYERHLPMNPLPAAHFGYAGTLLRAGRMEEGWIHYEYRLLDENASALSERQPRRSWSGQDLIGRTILVEAEQGYGDTIQFARYLPFLKARGAAVILRIPSALVRLARNLRGADRVVANEDALPEHDFRVHLLSLPAIFGTNAATIPRNTPYLRADERRKAAWRERLRPWTGIKVGLVWAGNPHHTRDEYRSIELSALAPLGRAKGIRFVSLQKSDPGIWGSVPPPGLELVDYSSELHNFEDTAALIDTLDLIISVDTAVLHLAGALAKPTWALLAAPPDFRWMDAGETTAWYPTMRLFRQRQRDEWNEVVDRMARALEAACMSRAFDSDEVFKTATAAKSTAGIGSDQTHDVTGTRDTANRRLFIVGETRYGMMQYRPDDVPVGRSLDRYGEYLQPALDALDHFLRPGMVVFESAAGIGAHSVELAYMVGPSGHLMLYEEDELSRRVLEQNLRTARAANVTIMRLASSALDDLGLRNLDLFKVNAGHHRGLLEGAIRTLRTLRPAVFLENADRASVMAVASQLQSHDYSVQCLAIPFFDPNNFRGNPLDVFEGRQTHAVVAIPHERNVVSINVVS